MKKITFLLFTFFTISLFSQNKLTSALNEFYDGTTWQNSYRTTYEYNANNNLANQKEFSWDSSNSTWKIASNQTYTYNNQNKIVNETYESYDFFSGNVNYGYKTIYNYNASNQINEVIDQEFVNNVWVNDYKNIYTYTDNKITELLNEEWNGSAWVLVAKGEDEDDEDASVKAVINYGSNGLVSALIFEEWNGTSWISDGRDTYTYNANNKITQSLTQDWNGTAYENEYKAEYTYDANGNLTLEKDFDFNNGVFTSNYQESYTFDTTKLMTGFANPFSDRTGFAALTGQDNRFVNKILTSYSGSQNRTTYYYGNEATASVNEFDNINFSVYPNPTTSIVKIDDSNFTLKNIEVYNIIGEKVLISSKNEINLEALVNGVYVLKVQSKSGNIATKRIIKN